MSARFRWLAAGLFLATLATLILEVLDTRLLSVLTWYHLSFLAVSVAMLGMAAGAVTVFLGGSRFIGDGVTSSLARYTLWFALAIPASHLANLAIPIPFLRQFAVMEFVALAVATIVLALPFVLSGIVVTLALTRTGGPIGRLYAADLFGAALGCLAVIALLAFSNITSVAFVAGAVAALSAWCFMRSGGAVSWRPLVTAALLGAIALANATTDRGLGVIYPKNRTLWLAQDRVAMSAWNTHSYVIIQNPVEERAFLWGAGRGSDGFRTTSAWIAIDGEAGTPITKWDGQHDSLAWVQYDVTSLPYHLRRGDAAVIGVGGGRDLLTALWGRSRVTGIEVNGILIDALTGPYRSFANLAGRDDVTLVHDEARSFLSRGGHRYDVLQMSLIDTWAATGAGAFTLSENGLYTREAWRVFLDALTPTGVFSVSRWFAPEALSETTRILVLGVAALQDRGVAEPSRHLMMVTRGGVATLLASPAPFDDNDRRVVEDLVRRFEFTVLVAPWAPPADARLRRIVSADAPVELEAATRDPLFDFTPPTDERPFFFNMLKPRGVLSIYQIPPGGVMWGNLRATSTLLALLVIAAAMVAAIVFWPLLRAGRPDVPPGAFGWALLYFATIGAGFMLIQIPFLQRFSVYLGHPTYSFAIILFTMILATGFGSLLSDRLDIDGTSKFVVPIAIALTLLATTMLIQTTIDATLPLGLAARSAVVVLFVAPVSILLGCCFPIGMRLIGRSSDRTAAWMWGVNGAAGVLASIAAVAVSMWVGTHANLLLAATGYLFLLWPMRRLAVTTRAHAPARTETALA